MQPWAAKQQPRGLLQKLKMLHPEAGAAMQASAQATGVDKFRVCKYPTSLP